MRKNINVEEVAGEPVVVAAGAVFMEGGLGLVFFEVEDSDGEEAFSVVAFWRERREAGFQRLELLTQFGFHLFCQRNGVNGFDSLGLHGFVEAVEGVEGHEELRTVAARHLRMSSRKGVTIMRWPLFCDAVQGLHVHLLSRAKPVLCPVASDLCVPFSGAGTVREAHAA